MNFDSFKGFDYEPQEDDESIVLSELPLQLIIDSIKEQFKDPSIYAKNDFVQVFETRYAVTKEEMTEDNEEEIERLYIRFVSFMRDIFKERLSIGLPYLEDIPEAEQLELIHYIYRFFVINIKPNFISYVNNYIFKYKERLADTLPKKRDATYKNLREMVNDPDLITIICNIRTVVPTILADDTIGVDEFLELSDDAEGRLENTYISEKYEDFNITGNFIPFYERMLDESTRIEIECTVRNHILMKTVGESGKREKKDFNVTIVDADDAPIEEESFEDHENDIVATDDDEE